ncbi:MAG: polyribonucleotide nucleotidyltransferase, partial [Candidatus Eisenbacteria bacterium]|nr:polyribonucleotide nucleotidyltransferase [Candidatus Eisenbacteria bacterium]
MPESVSLEIGGKTLTLESGHWAKQANGAVVVRYEETVVLAATVGEKEPRPGKDFFPLLVDYREKMYASGRIPGGFFKREGRPTEKEILCCRITDRSLRPMFPEGYMNETQVLLNVLSHDQQNDSDTLGLVGGSAALLISDIPFHNAVSCVRVGRSDGSFVINPTIDEQDECDLNLVVAGTKDSVVMVEGAAEGASEADVLESIRVAHDVIKQICDLQEQLKAKISKPKFDVIPPVVTEGLAERVDADFGSKLREANQIKEKAERGDAISAIKDEALAAYAEVYPDNLDEVKGAIGAITKKDMRDRILKDGVRSDGRGLDDIRKITCETGVLPRTHGSSVFTRGQTQALVVATLGTQKDEQRIDAMEGESWKSYMLHYNFPSFSVGEARPNRGPGRREIGHGKLAERALEPVIPAEETFPYTVRIVSEILESNGSSSMASVCGGSLSLMDAG